MGKMDFEVFSFACLSFWTCETLSAENGWRGYSYFAESKHLPDAEKFLSLSNFGITFKSHLDFYSFKLVIIRGCYVRFMQSSSKIIS